MSIIDVQESYLIIDNLGNYTIMNERVIKRPPSGGIRYSTTSEIEERIRGTSHCVVKIPEYKHSIIDHNLYDEIKQSLDQVELSLNRAMHLPSEKAYFDLNEMQTLLKRALENVYELLLGLHPSILNQYGLLPVLLWYFESYTAKTNILVNFKHRGLNRNFTLEISNAAFHIIRESLNNISGNSTDKEVTVQIWVEKEVLNIWVENYRISSVHTMASATSEDNKSIEDQVRVLGGKLVLDSSGFDARLTVELPL